MESTVLVVAGYQFCNSMMKSLMKEIVIPGFRNLLRRIKDHAALPLCNWVKNKIKVRQKNVYGMMLTYQWLRDRFRSKRIPNPRTSSAIASLQLSKIFWMILLGCILVVFADWCRVGYTMRRLSGGQLIHISGICRRLVKISGKE